MNDHLVRNVLIGAALLIGVAISIGFSFAYFTANIKGNEDAKLMTVNAGTMELTFVDNNTFDLSNAQPGDKESKTFSVENTGTIDDEFNYNIKLVDVNTTFLKRDLKYILEECEDSACNSIKADGIKEEGYINTDSVKNKEMYLAVDILRPENNQKQYYKLTIDFQELNIDQSYNKEASFIGKVNVDAEEGAKLYVQEANKPELYQGMIPIYFKEGNIYIANPDKDDWYNYDNNEWANAVLIDNSDSTTKAKFYEGDKLKVDTQVQEEDILQMYVWIPRYRYKLFNAEGQTGVEKQIIDIEFEKGTETTGNVSCTYTDLKNGTVKEDCKNATNGNWYTHPAFTFGNTELKGFWVGKFEPSDPNDLTGGTKTDINEITILPNKISMVNKSVLTLYNAERDIEKQDNKYNLNSSEIDTRPMKNSEWGAVAYLTQSIYGIYKDEKTCNINGMTKENCEVWINNTAQGTGTEGTYRYGGTATGCVGTSVNAGVEWNTDGTQPAQCKEENKWSTGGVKASTTGNMYGIYDMSGGAWEYVMGVTKTQNGNDIYYASSGFAKTTMPEAKYYDLYDFSTSNTTHERGHLGDSTRETLKTFGNFTGSWNSDYAVFPSVPSEGAWPWFRRGGCYGSDSHAGVFTFDRVYGGAYVDESFRSVLSAA